MKDLVLHPSEFTLKVLSDCVNFAPWPVKLSLSIVSFVANTVARAIASSKQSYYANQVSCLKSSDPNCWWKHIKQLHGKSPSYVNFTISHNGSILSVTRLLDFLNHFFCFCLWWLYSSWPLYTSCFPPCTKTASCYILCPWSQVEVGKY